MSKLDELGGIQEIKKWLEMYGMDEHEACWHSVNVGCVYCRDKALIEKVEELEAQLLDANGTIEVLNGLINLRNISADSIKAELTKLRELREMVKSYHEMQTAPYGVPFEACIDELCIKAREAIKESS